MKLPHAGCQRIDRTYGVKIDWDAYTSCTRFLCRLPIINRLFTRKVRVDVTGFAGSRPIMGTLAVLRMPTINHSDQYFIRAKLPNEAFSRSNHRIDKLFIYIVDIGDNRIAESVNALAWEDRYNWRRYMLISTLPKS